MSERCGRASRAAARLATLALMVACALPALRYVAPRAALSAAPSARSFGEGSVPSEVVVSTYEVTYDVAGTSAAELRDAMLRAGPRDHDGSRSYGYQASDMRWRYWWSPAAGDCGVRRSEVTFTSVITLPRWRPPSGTSPALVAAWDSFVAALGTHELGHRALAYRTAAEIADTLKAVRAPRCPEIGAETNAAVRSVLARGSARQKRYDKETDHGGTQGAVWPPQPPATTTAERKALR